MIPSIDSNTGLDTSSKGTYQAGPGAVPASGGGADASSPGALMDDSFFLRRAQEASSQAQVFMNSVRGNWARAYNAYRNQHFDGSKYKSAEYRSRSQIFRPKTRTAVRKAVASAASALLATGDIVAVTAQNDADDFQVASAQIKQQLMNYRLSRTSRRNGIPWMMVSMGARQDSILAGICASKQYWLFKEQVITPQTDEYLDDDGVSVPASKGKTRVLIDRPDIMPIPPENVLFDINCDWTNPAQSSEYLIVRYAMSAEKALDMITNSPRLKVPWYDVTMDDLRGHRQATGPYDTIAPRLARGGGKDPIMMSSGTFAPIWLEEVFMRVNGADYVFWTIDNMQVISKPVLTEDVYDWLDGERPIVIGYGALESHRPYPMSAAESWQQMQQEINDQSNLRLDHMKQVVTPPAKVVRGRKVDLTQVQRRGPNGIIMLQDQNDVQWAEIPDLPSSSYQEQQLLNSDFDDLAGAFNAGTVQNNRALNETVGGMRLLAGDSNAVAEFDLSLWSESWAERVLWQVLKLEEHYESDPVVLSIAGEKAQLYEKYGVNHITDELLMAETTLTIKLGIGSAALPMEKIQKFAQASGVVQQVLAPFMQMGLVHIVPKAQEIIETVFGAAGFSDGGDRFFDVIDVNPNGAGQQPDPKAATAQAAQQVQQQKSQVDMAKIAASQRTTQTKAQVDMAKLAFQKQDSEAQRAADIALAHQKSLAEIGRAMISTQHDAAMQGRDHANQRSSALNSIFHDLLSSGLSQQQQPQPRAPAPQPATGAPAAAPAPVLPPQAQIYREELLGHAAPSAPPAAPTGGAEIPLNE